MSTDIPENQECNFCEGFITKKYTYRSQKYDMEKTCLLSDYFQLHHFSLFNLQTYDCLHIQLQQIELVFGMYASFDLSYTVL